MANKTMEVFPDLHHKMSKKIAQLTKVIYHLNTKNEDHQTELDIMSANHQMEIQQILRDAAARIGKFKEVMESKQASLNQDAKIEKLQKKHEAEKQAAIQEFSNFKAKMAERDQKLAQGFQKKYDSLRSELEGVNKKFQERIEQFETTNRDLKRALDDTSKAGSSEVQDLRKRYDAEVAELVRSSNEKYQNMLVEQLGVQSAIRKEMEEKLEQLRRELEEQHRRDLETELGRERAIQGGDKQEALMALRRELEEQLAQQKAALTAQLDKLAAEAKAKGEESAAAQARADLTISDLNLQLEALKRSMDDQAGGQEARVQALGREAAALKDQLSASQARVAQREEELAAMRGMLGEKNAALVALEDKLRLAQEEALRLRDLLDSAEKNGAASADELRSKLAVSQREAESFRTEINQIAASLATVRDELKKSEKAAAKAAADHAKEMEGLNAEKEALQAQIAQLRAAAGSASADAQQEIERLQKTLESRVAQLQQERLAAVQEGERLLATAAENHKAQLEGQAAAHQLQLDAHAQREREWGEERAALSSRHAAEMEATTTQLTQQLEEAVARHTAEAATLKASLSALEGQLQSLSEQADSERSGLKAEAAKWEGKVKGLQKELDARKKDYERAEGVTSSLKNQVESLREELKASQKAFREKMDMSTAKLEADWQARLDAQVADAEKQLNALRGDLVKQHQAEMEELARRHEEDVQSLKSLLQKEHDQAANELAEAERQRQQLEADLKAERAARQLQVGELVGAHTAQARAAEEAHRQELERLKRELRSAAEGREAQMAQLHAAEVERLNRLVEGTTVEYTQRMAAALEASKLAAEEAQRQALADQESRHRRQQAEALDGLAREHAEAVRLQTAQFDAERQTLQRSLEDAQEQCADARALIAGLEKTIGDERKERQRREEAFVLERDQLERTHDSDIRREKETAERKILEVMERANADISILKSEHVEVRQQYEQRISEITGQFRALEKRFLNRESREEDVARIEQLMREMIEKDELVLRTREEMQYFKREMLNREENYNQKFGKSPNVGVMQVIKPKDPSEDNNKAGQGGRAKPTQMRLVNPNGGNMVGGMGVGMGVGLGVGGVGGGTASLAGSTKSSKPGK